MPLSRLHINNVRNLLDLELQDLQQVNIFFGRNGSGKTSILEAVHLLGMARSFRGNSIKTLITHGASACTVFGSLRLASSSSPAGLALGIQRDMSGAVQIRMAGKQVRKLAQLAEQLPLQVITADSFGLLTGSPVARRQYLDWGVFHVEHRFYTEWQRFQRCIKQRNKLLRRGKISGQEIQVWTRDLATSGTAINEFRQAYLQTLTPRFKAIMRGLMPSLQDLELNFRQGWDRRLSYAEVLENSVSTDLEQGYTHSGPQRADIRVTHGGFLAADTLSRGQQKLVVCGLKLAQGQLMSELGRGTCTYLIDDLPSELDHEHSQLVCAVLASMEAQVFVSCIERQDISEVWPENSEMAMFHVEHGTVKGCPDVG